MRRSIDESKTGLMRVFPHLLQRLLLAVALACAAAPLAAHAQSFEAAVARFAPDSFVETEKAVGEIAASGNTRAAEVIAALAEGRLFVRTADKRVFIRDRAGAVSNAADGALEPDLRAADLKLVRVNNRLRRVVEAALGSLTLLSSDPGKRLEAAQAVFKSRDASALATVEAALAKEPESGVRRALERARAAILLTKADASEADRLRAIPVVRADPNQDTLALLSAVPPDASPAVQQAAADARSAIERRLALLSNVQNAWYGVSLASVLLLAAIGLAITFGQMGVINMAHGEMVMLGAYTTFVVQEMIRSRAPWLFDASLFIAIPLAFLVAGAVGVAIERGIIRFLYGRPLETLLATWGLSLILQQAVRTIFGPTNREVGNPSWMSGALDLGGLSLTYNRIAIVAFSLGVFAALLLVLRRTSLGLQVRAVTQNRRMAAAMGIRTDWVDALTFGLGSGVAGMAGVALSQIDNVSPNLGQSYIIDSFLVVVFGGVGNLWGTFVGALVLGIANKFLEPYAGAVLGKIALLVAIILFIQKRPRGLFALKGRAVEA